MAKSAARSNRERVVDASSSMKMGKEVVAAITCRRSWEFDQPNSIYSILSLILILAIHCPRQCTWTCLRLSSIENDTSTVSHSSVFGNGISWTLIKHVSYASCCHTYNIV